MLNRCKIMRWFGIKKRKPNITHTTIVLWGSGLARHNIRDADGATAAEIADYLSKLPAQYPVNAYPPHVCRWYCSAACRNRFNTKPDQAGNVVTSNDCRMAKPKDSG